MLINTLKCCSKHIGSTAFDYNLYSFGGTQRRRYANGNKSGCCTDQPQTAGRTVEPWPKPGDQPPPQWRRECPQDCMPYNNDPYRIKVPEIAVPPLPASNAKRMGVLTSIDPRDPLGLKDWSQQHGPPNQGQQMEHHPQPQSEPQAEQEDDNFLTKLKKFFRGKDNQDQITKEPDVLC